MIKQTHSTHHFFRTTYQSLLVLAVSCFCVLLPVQSVLAGGVRKAPSLKCKLSANLLQVGHCQDVTHVKEYIARCEQHMASDYIGDLKAKASKLEAECGKSAEEPTVGACTYDKAILEIEKRAEVSVVFGEQLRKILRLELPTYPDSSFSVSTSANDISMSIDDPDSWEQWVANTADSVNGFAGLFADLPPGMPSIFDVLGEGYMGKVADIGKLSSSITTVLGAVGGWVQDNKKTGSNNVVGGIPQFLIDHGQTLQNVTKVRKGIICYVKGSLPIYFDHYDALATYREKVKNEIADNQACQANGASKSKSYNKLMAIKLKPAKKPYIWIFDSKLGASRRDAQSTWEQRNTWADSGWHGGSPNIMAETDCSRNDWEHDRLNTRLNTLKVKKASTQKSNEKSNEPKRKRSASKIFNLVEDTIDSWLDTFK